MRIEERVSLSTPVVAGQVALENLTGQIITLRANDIVAVEELRAEPRSAVYKGDKCQVYFGEHAVVVRSTAAAVITLIDSALNSFAQTPAIYQDEKSAGTAGGTFTSGDWRTRDLNTEQADRGNLGSLSANRVTLVPGIYLVEAHAPAFIVDRHQLRLWNIDAASTLLTGTSNLASSADLAETMTHLRGEITLTVDTRVELQHRCQTTRATDGFGLESNFALEVYAQIVFIRIGDT